MAELKQNADGSVSLVREVDSQEVLRVGGPTAPSGSQSTHKATTITTVPLMALGTQSITTNLTGVMAAWTPPDGNAQVITRTVIRHSLSYNLTNTLNIGTAADGVTSGTNIASALNIQNTGNLLDLNKSLLLPAGQYVTVTPSQTPLITGGLYGYMDIHHYPQNP